ncbi:hypothetical protein [Polaribacter sp. HaHaR_3_91]|uniref:hypothetical protein n=1 Tax=Polaribacter sp. HaHaR_3_91 TaxID=2745561 RepID=UPI001C4F2DF5|nr:hypothetical protein [Polaribacter sp. HaHaR_3_91]QXP63245.1 hypothetical protein H0I27_15560 [Polaribacter sp. HaHaR_3_91]
MKWENSYLTEIEWLIFEGARKAYLENTALNFQESDFQIRMIEYLINVNVAKSLYVWAAIKNINIHFEYPLKGFFLNAFDEDNWKQNLSRNDKDSKFDDKRILDIALTGSQNNNSNASLIGLEIKSINKSESKIKEDVDKLSDALSIKDKVSENSIKAGYSLFLEDLNEGSGEKNNAELEKKKENLLHNWELRLEKYRDQYPLLNYKILTNDIVKFSNEDLPEVAKEILPALFDVNEVELAEIIIDHMESLCEVEPVYFGRVVSIIIKITNKNSK